MKNTRQMINSPRWLFKGSTWKPKPIHRVEIAQHLVLLKEEQEGTNPMNEQCAVKEQWSPLLTAELHRQQDRPTKAGSRKEVRPAQLRAALLQQRRHLQNQQA